MDGEGVRDSLLEVVKDPPAHAHCMNDRREVVIKENQVRRLPGDVCTSQAHGDSDVGRLKRWRIVDAVPGHGHHVTRFFERLDEAKLLVRHRPGEYVYRSDPLSEGACRHASQFGTCDNARNISEARLAGDAPCGTRVVAGNHHDSDSRLSALLDGA